MMTVTINTYDNCIVVSIPLRSTVSELNKWKIIIYEILRYSLKGIKFHIYTLSPQEYSFGYELGNFNEMAAEKEKILVNYVENPTDKLIYDITNSEEFERGLLKIVVSNEQKIVNGISLVGANYNSIKDELIFCEDDGVTFYWYNPHIPKDIIQIELKKIITHQESND